MAVQGEGMISRFPGEKGGKRRRQKILWNRLRFTFSAKKSETEAVPENFLSASPTSLLTWEP